MNENIKILEIKKKMLFMIHNRKTYFIKTNEH